MVCCRPLVPLTQSKTAGGKTLSLPAYVLEDWMKRSYCLLQVLDYKESVKKTSGVCYKSLKSCHALDRPGGGPFSKNSLFIYRFPIAFPGESVILYYELVCTIIYKRIQSERKKEEERWLTGLL